MSKRKGKKNFLIIGSNRNPILGYHVQEISYNSSTVLSAILKLQIFVALFISHLTVFNTNSALPSTKQISS